MKGGEDCSALEQAYSRRKEERAEIVQLKLKFEKHGPKQEKNYNT